MHNFNGCIKFMFFFNMQNLSNGLYLSVLIVILIHFVT